LLNDVIRSHRLQSDQKVTEVAALIGVQRESLCRIEAGTRRAGPRLLTLLAESIPIPSSAWVRPFLAEETRVGPLVHVAGYLLDRGDLHSAQVVLERALRMSQFSRHERHKHDLYLQLGRYAYFFGSYSCALHWLKKWEQLMLSHPSLKVTAQRFGVTGVTDQLNPDFAGAALMGMRHRQSHVDWHLAQLPSNLRMM